MKKSIQSQLAKYQAESLSDDEIHQKKRKAWLDNEGLYLNVAQIEKLPLEYQWAIEIIGNLTYK